MKKLVKNIFTVTLPSILFLILFFEFFFRFVIVASTSPQAIFDKKELMFLYDSKARKEGLFTGGKFAQPKGKWRINNYGWNSPIDYIRRKEKKRIAVIGDSYIEAFHVDVDKSYPSLLRAQLGTTYDVYSFGISGAPFSQYLHINRYVNKLFDPEIIIFNIVHNDFIESILHLNPNSYIWLRLEINNKEIKEVLPSPYYPSLRYRFIKSIIKNSALFKYLRYNLKINKLYRSVFKKNDTGKYNANVNITTLQKNKELISSATKYILNQIRLENLNRRIIFIMDAPKHDLYKNKFDSNVLFLHQIFEKYCLKNNFELIDLIEPMKKDYKLNHIKFNSKYDSHWNEYGHKFVCSQLLNRLAADLE